VLVKWNFTIVAPRKNSFRSPFANILEKILPAPVGTTAASRPVFVGTTAASWPGHSSFVQQRPAGHSACTWCHSLHVDDFKRTGEFSGLPVSDSPPRPQVILDVVMRRRRAKQTREGSDSAKRGSGRCGTTSKRRLRSQMSENGADGRAETWRSRH